MNAVDACPDPPAMLLYTCMSGGATRSCKLLVLAHVTESDAGLPACGDPVGDSA